MTRATQKEQATTSLKTNSMNVNHVEYKQGFENDLERNLSNCKDKLMAAVFHASVMLLTIVCYTSSNQRL